MGRITILLYGILSYLIFFCTFCYIIFFLQGLLVPKTILNGPEAPVWQAILINASFLVAFVIQHTIMARNGFKKWWTRIIPPAAERSTFVLITSLILIGMMWQWRPIGQMVWQVDNLVLEWVIRSVSFLGFGIVLYSTFLIDHFDLFGLRQVILHAMNKQPSPTPFNETSLYKHVRHPLMVGFAIAFWATPTMTFGSLLFAVLTTAYIVIGTKIEERTLIANLGDTYVQYMNRTPGLIPFTKRRPRNNEQPREATVPNAL